MQIVKQLLLNEDDELNNNFMFLPFSIHTPLSIVASGMKDPTSERLLFLLGFKSLDDLQAKVNDPQLMAIFASSDQKNAKGPTICSVHGSRIDKKYTFNHSFHQLPQTLYKADSSTVDFENKVKTWAKLLNTFCSSWKLEMELIYKVQMQCYEDAKLMKLFPEMIRSLYEQKVLAEEAIIHWFHRGTNPKGRQNFVKALKPFVDWLKEA